MSENPVQLIEMKDRRIKELQEKVVTLLRLVNYYQAKTRMYESELRKHGIKSDFDL